MSYGNITTKHKLNTKATSKSSWYSKSWIIASGTQNIVQDSVSAFTGVKFFILTVNNARVTGVLVNGNGQVIFPSIDTSSLTLGYSGQPGIGVETNLRGVGCQIQFGMNGKLDIVFSKAFTSNNNLVSLSVYDIESTLVK